MYTSNHCPSGAVGLYSNGVLGMVLGSLTRLEVYNRLAVATCIIVMETERAIEFITRRKLTANKLRHWLLVNLSAFDAHHVALLEY